MKVSGKWDSPEHSEEFFMLAKRFVSKEIGGFDENKLEKKSLRKMPVFKKQKSDIVCWAGENLL